MKQNRTKSSNLFLLELILAILFFIIASAVCVQLFVKSHLISNDSKTLNAAINQATSAAEAFKSGDSLEESYASIEKVFPEADIQKQTGLVTIPYVIDGTNYKMVLQIQSENQLAACNILVNASESRENETNSNGSETQTTIHESIYQITVTKHFQRRVNE